SISTAINNRDTLVTQRTGSGKSLCYVIPPLCNATTTVIASPTISLMTDKATKLNRTGIKATFLGSAQKEIINKLDQLKSVFTTPESFFDDAKKSMALKVMIFVNYATCNHNTGQIVNVMNKSSYIPEVPIMILTATAPIEVKEVFEKIL
uniref:DNA 3'-5' helicase n=2 Tax=Amphimedon queenslandica TaxID=400682 RepID=A0A1X7UDG3_AMPQE